MKRIIAALCLTGVFSAGIYAQSTGSLSGTITDPNGAAVAGARVEAKEVLTGVAWKTAATEAGLYVLPTLPVGTYSLTIEHQGFKRRVQTDIEVRVGLRQTIDVLLEIGEVQQTIEISAAPPLLETTMAERGQNVSPKLMNALPIYNGSLRNAE